VKCLEIRQKLLALIAEKGGAKKKEKKLKKKKNVFSAEVIEKLFPEKFLVPLCAPLSKFQQVSIPLQLLN